MTPHDYSLRVQPRELGWLAGLAGLLLFAAILHPVERGTPVADADLRAALRRGADRLVRLQEADGSWGPEPGLPGDLSRSGRPALALLAAGIELRNPRYLEAAGRTVATLRERLPRDLRLAVPENLRLLAEHAHHADRPEDLALARSAWSSLRDAEGWAEPEFLARRYLGQPRPAGIDLDTSSWRNYLLWRAGERAQAAEVIGESGHGARFALAIFEEWVPKRSADFWVMGASAGVETLDSEQGHRADWLRRHHDRLLDEETLLGGIPWNDTPHDCHAETQQTAIALRAQLLVVPPGSSRQRRLFEGLQLLVSRQARSGGWPSHLNLAPAPLDPASPSWVPDEQLGVGETPEIDAEVLLTLTAALEFSRGT